MGKVDELGSLKDGLGEDIDEHVNKMHTDVFNRQAGLEIWRTDICA